MNEQQTTSNVPSTASDAQPGMSGGGAMDSNAREPAWVQPGYVVSGILALLLAANWWTSQNQISALREEVARRLLSADTVSSETKILAKNVQETTKEIQAKVILLEGKQSEAQSQQLALEQLYRIYPKIAMNGLWLRLSRFWQRPVNNCNWQEMFRGH